MGPSGKPKLIGEELSVLKQKLREQSKKIKAMVTFRLREMGEIAQLKTEPESRVPLFLADVQHLIMYSQVGLYKKNCLALPVKPFFSRLLQLGHLAPYSPARWCAVNKWSKLQSTTVLIVENISLQHFTEFEEKFPYLNTTFDYKLEMLTPCSYDADLVQELLMVPLTGES